jgi:hypothetical protein
LPPAAVPLFDRAAAPEPEVRHRQRLSIAALGVTVMIIVA